MKIFNRKISVRLSMAIIVITILLISVVVIFAAGNFAVPYTFTAGSTISSSEVNANFQAIGGNLPASKTSASSGTLDITSSGLAEISSLAVTPSSNGYLLVFSRVTVTAIDASATGVQVCLTPTSSSSYLNCHFISSTGEYNTEYSQGAVAASNTLNYSFKAQGVGGNATVQAANISALFIPAPNQLP